VIGFESLSGSINFDPVELFESKKGMLNNYVYDRLLDINPNYEVKPLLAKNYYRPSEKEWVFELRENVKFSNGKLLTPEDVKFSIERAREDENSELKSTVANIEEIEIRGSKIIIRTRESSPLLPYRIHNVGIVSREYVEEKGEDALKTNPVGTGRYLVEEIREKSVVFRFNPNFWGNDVEGIPKTPVKKVIFKEIETDHLGALENKEVDILKVMPSEQDKVKCMAGYEVREMSSDYVYFLNFNYRDKTNGFSLTGDLNQEVDNPFRNKKLRKAISLAIDYEKLAKKTMDGTASKHGQVVTPRILGYNPSLGEREYDPEKAKILLEEAGYPRGFEVRLIYARKYQNALEISESIKEDLEKVGVRVEIEAVSIGELVEKTLAGNVPIYWLGWYPDTGEMLTTAQYLFHSQGNLNLGGYHNPQADKLIDEASKRGEYYLIQDKMQELSRAIIEDYAIIPLLNPKEVFAVSKDLKLNWIPRSSGEIYLWDTRK
jgi:peptide/nickel transport system substrate-binding protein